MAKNKIVTDQEIISFYMEYTLEKNAKPNSVYSFAKQFQFEEEIFYQYFGNFDALEQTIFKVFFDKTVELLEKSKDYHTYDARNKMLSFYYSFFELLTANRSYVSYSLGSNTDKLKKIKTLQILKKSFSKYVESLEIELLDSKQETIDKIQKNTLKESSWLQLILTLKYWLDDSSPSFQKTDIFIEKSVNTSFDLMNIHPLKSVIDLGKFLLKDKSIMN